MRYLGNQAQNWVIHDLGGLGPRAWGLGQKRILALSLLLLDLWQIAYTKPLGFSSHL